MSAKAIRQKVIKSNTFSEPQNIAHQDNDYFPRETQQSNIEKER